MNYFEHHIRDYDTATSHLTWEEDLAYTRLIRWYYRKEKPVPADVKEACRQVRAVSKAQREAVAAVLAEFFDLQDDGWHNATCDQAIKRYQDGEPEREVKKANEENRVKRHREERAQLFKIITEAGLHAPWNIGITELRTLAGRIPVGNPVTEIPETVTQPVTAPATLATATQSPITNHQSPVLKPKGNDDSTDSGSALSSFDHEPDLPPAAGAPLPPLEPQPPSNDPAIALSVALRKLHVDCMFTSPAVLDWVRDGVTLVVLSQAVAIAREQKPTGKIPPNYLIPIVQKILNPPAATASTSAARPASPPRKPQGMDPKGLDESYDEYDARIRAAEANRRKGPPP